jgi:hypothetical protein
LQRIDETSKPEVKTYPADAAKEGRPYHTGEGLCNRRDGSYLLDIFYILAAAGAVSQLKVGSSESSLWAGS